MSKGGQVAHDSDSSTKRRLARSCRAAMKRRRSASATLCCPHCTCAMPKLQAFNVLIQIVHLAAALCVQIQYDMARGSISDCDSVQCLALTGLSSSSPAKMLPRGDRKPGAACTCAENISWPRGTCRGQRCGCSHPAPCRRSNAPLHVAICDIDKAGFSNSKHCNNVSSSSQSATNQLRTGQQWRYQQVSSGSPCVSRPAASKKARHAGSCGIGPRDRNSSATRGIGRPRPGCSLLSKPP